MKATRGWMGGPATLTIFPDELKRAGWTDAEIEELWKRVEAGESFPKGPTKAEMKQMMIEVQQP